jgi:hypothetical protein
MNKYGFQREQKLIKVLTINNKRSTLISLQLVIICEELCERGREKRRGRRGRTNNYIPN